MRRLLVRWYITVPGLLLSFAVAALAFSFFPPQYVSSGTALLVQPTGSPSQNPAQNPLLTYPDSLNTTASILIQVLNVPTVAKELGLTAGKESFIVSPTGGVSASGVPQPFISVSAKSPDAQASMDIVSRVLSRAQSELAQRQNELHVRKAFAIRLASVVDPTPPKLVATAPLAAFGASLTLGILATIAIVLAFDRISVRRSIREILLDSPIEKSDGQSNSNSRPPVVVDARHHSHLTNNAPPVH